MISLLSSICFVLFLLDLFNTFASLLAFFFWLSVWKLTRGIFNFECLSGLVCISRSFSMKSSVWSTSGGGISNASCP